MNQKSYKELFDNSQENIVVRIFSYWGKDYLEASGMPQKASYLFRELCYTIRNILIKKEKTQTNEITREEIWEIFDCYVMDFSNFIYSDRVRADYFYQQMMDKLAGLLNDLEFNEPQKEELTIISHPNKGQEINVDDFIDKSKTIITVK